MSQRRFYLGSHLVFLVSRHFFLSPLFSLWVAAQHLLCHPRLCLAPPSVLLECVGGVTLYLSCVFLSEAFFADELMMSGICCRPEKLYRCVYVGLFVSNVMRLSPRYFAASCTTSSCVGGAGRSYAYLRGGKNTTVSDIRSAHVVGTHPL